MFRGNEEIDPRLNITSRERLIQGVEARVRIQGTARNPQLSLSSNPPLDDGDILALIVSISRSTNSAPDSRTR